MPQQSFNRRSLTSSDVEHYSKDAHSHVENAPTLTKGPHSPSAEGYDAELTLHYTKYPNRWSRIREYIKEPAAEFFGVMILIIFGNGVDCQTVLSKNTAVAASPMGNYLSLNFGWAVGTALGVWVSSGISGGHINPAVTIAFATFRDFPWRKVPAYIFAQLMGGLCGAGIVYANYIHAIDLVEGGRNIRTVPGTAGLFSTYALPYMTSVSCFFDEFVGTAVLLMVVCAVSDTRNGPPPRTGYAINPARDLGPRLLTSMVGYGREGKLNHYWLWCPVIAPIIGALVGVFLYDACLFTGAESILNKPDARARALHEKAINAERQRPIAGVENV
ncbi:aquaporin [Fomes fomentarius]|nr:aquaporin [Fomes fomentarius]